MKSADKRVEEQAFYEKTPADNVQKRIKTLPTSGAYDWKVGMMD